MTRRLSMAMFALAAALPMIAQPGGGPPRGGGFRIDYLAGYLGLTESQKTQATTIFDAAKSASETARGQMTSARSALATAVKANAADNELDRLAAAIGVIEGQLAGIQAKANAKFYALLTAEQKAKYDAMGNRGEGGGPRRR